MRFTGLAAFTRPLLYHPTAVRVEGLARGGFVRTELETAPGARLVGLVRPGAADAPWLVFFGGNAMGLDAARAVLAMSAGPEPWGLVAFAYRGYDGSSGRPSQDALLADARCLAEAVLAGRFADAGGAIAPERLVLIGQSLGSGVAVDLAAHLSDQGRPPRAVVLLSPYTSIAQVFADQVPLLPVRWLVSDPYRTDRCIQRVRCPLWLVHGERDTLIAIRHSERLHALVGPRATLVRLEGRDHGDLWEDRRTVLTIRAAAAPPAPHREEPPCSESAS